MKMVHKWIRKASCAYAAGEAGRGNYVLAKPMSKARKCLRSITANAWRCAALEMTRRSVPSPGHPHAPASIDRPEPGEVAEARPAAVYLKANVVQCTSQ